MEGSISAAVVGILCVLLGILNMRGNISTLHRYHRHRVSEEDRLPFGKRVGLGTVIIGCSMLAFSLFSFVADHTETELFILIGTVILILGLITGLLITFRAMLRYNKGIF